MADYVKIGRRFLAEHSLPRPETQIKPGAEAAALTEPSQEQIDQAGRILAQAGMRLLELQGVPTVGLWSDLDGPEVRAAIATFHPGGVPVRYLDGDDVPMKYKLRRVPGEPVPANVLAAMEQEPDQPWIVRDRLLGEMYWAPAGVPWAEYQAERLNKLFLEQGATGRPGRITAATVRHGEPGEAQVSMTNHQRKAEICHAGNLEAARIIAADPERYPGAMQEWTRLVLNPPAERTAPATGRAACEERGARARPRAAGGPAQLLAYPERVRLMRCVRGAAGSGSRTDPRQGLSLSRALRELRAGSKQPGRRTAA